jgi:hypothetical protein
VSYYAVYVEGGREAWSYTKGDTAADFDEAHATALERSKSGRNYVVRHHERDTARIILTADLGETVWPRLASPPVPSSEFRLTPELEAEA